MANRVQLLGVLLAASRLLLAGESGLHREGAYWVETMSGSEAVAEGEQLKITSLGDVVVHGADRGQIEYSAQRRVRAHSESEARDALQEGGASLTRQGRNLRLAIDASTGSISLQVTVPRTLRAVIVGTESGSVEVSDFGGNVFAQTGAGDVRVNHIKGSVQISTAGGTLHLGDVGSWAQATTAGGDITAESIGGEARLQTAGGDIAVQKAGANIRAVTEGGKVRIGQAAGQVMASSGGGLIDIGRAGGTVSAHNSAGPIMIGSSVGRVDCQSMSGEIRVGVMNGVFKIVTASGNITAQLSGDRLLGESYISTGSGDITISLPSHLSATVRVRNSGASDARGIISDFSEMQIRAERGYAIAQGLLNGGGPLLQIQGTSGTIRIKKK